MTRAEHFSYILTELDEDLIEEAAAPVPRTAATRRVHGKRWASLAACLLLVVGVWRFFPRMGSSEAPNEAAPGAVEPGASKPAGLDWTGRNDGAQEDPGYGITNTPGTFPGPMETSAVGGTVPDPFYALAPDAITVYTPVPGLWQTTRVVDKAAKRLTAVLTVSQPEPAEQAGTNVPIAWLDLGSGTAVALFSGDYAIVYHYEGTFHPDGECALTAHLKGIFPGLEEALLQALENPTETWGESAAPPG